MPMKKILFLLFLFAFEGSFLIAQNKKNRGYHVHVGDTVPNFVLHLDSGDSLSLNSLRGKVVVLQFTASWCSVCRKEMPHLEKEVWQAFKNRNFILIGVDYDEPLDKVKAFKKQMHITYPMALDPNATIFSRFAFKKSGVTRNVVIDPHGKIVFLTRLYDRKEFLGMVKKISSLVKK